MHLSAMANGRHFFECYAKYVVAEKVRVVDIGAQDVNGSLKQVCPPHFEYVGVDFVEGKGVDIVLEDPYSIPLDTNSADIVLSSSCFEHSEMFWLTFLEIMRILKPNGLFYLNVPQNGMFHRYPVDCWRFYPDSGRALVSWAKRNGMNAMLLESYTSAQMGPFNADGQWNDYVAVFLKEENHATQFPHRIVDTKKDLYNGIRSGRDGFINESQSPEDKSKLYAIHGIAGNLIKLS